MPKYFPFKICGYYLYFTAHCVVECMHVHASNEELTEPGSAKFFVRSDGSSKLTAFMFNCHSAPFGDIFIAQSIFFYYFSIFIKLNKNSLFPEINLVVNS